MGNRVLVRNGDVVQGPIVPTGSPVNRFFFLKTMCNGEAQQLEDGQMMPRANIRSNSWQAILSRSGGSLRGQEATGGPLVGMWWVTVCFTGWSRGGGQSKHENSVGRAVKLSDGSGSGTDGLGEGSWVRIPWTCSWVRVSTRQR